MSTPTFALPSPLPRWLNMQHRSLLHFEYYVSPVTIHLGHYLLSISFSLTTSQEELKMDVLIVTLHSCNFIVLQQLRNLFNTLLQIKCAYLAAVCTCQLGRCTLCSKIVQLCYSAILQFSSNYALISTHYASNIANCHQKLNQ